MALDSPLILFIQPVFGPCDSIFELNKKSLLSLLSYLENQPYRLDIRIGGWVYKDEYWIELLDIVKRLTCIGGVKVITKRFKHNYGKSYFVNKLFKIKVPEKSIQYILTIDSDIKFYFEEPNIFERLIAASDQLEDATGKPFGCIAPNLLNDIGKSIADFKKDKKLVYDFCGIKEELVWNSNYDGGVLGGAFFISLEAWRKTNGYRQYNQSYAPEDAFFLMSLNGLGYSFAIMKSLSFFHPDIVSEGYASWKNFMTHRKYILFEDYDRNVHMANIKESEKFWKRYNKEFVHG